VNFHHTHNHHKAEKKILAKFNLNLLPDFSFFVVVVSERIHSISSGKMNHCVGWVRGDQWPIIITASDAEVNMLFVEVEHLCG
jgi:hypothetical protein